MSYSPTLGRWVQQDPAGYVDGPNLYGAYLNSPATVLDPDGLDSYGIIGGGGSTELTRGGTKGGGTTRPTTQPTTAATCPATRPTTGPRLSDGIKGIVDRLNADDLKERDKASQDLRKVDEKVIQDALDRPDWELSPEQRIRMEEEAFEQRLQRGLQRDVERLQNESSTKPFGPFGPSGGPAR